MSQQRFQAEVMDELKMKEEKLKPLTQQEIEEMFSGFVYQDQIFKIVRRLEKHYNIGDKK